MKTIWSEGLKQEEVESVKAVLTNSVFIRQFAKILKSQKEMLERKGLKESDYDVSDWQAKQTFNNGRLAMLYDLVDLLTP